MPWAVPALCRKLPLWAEIGIDTVRNPLYHIFLHIRVLHFLVIALVGHETHLQNGDRYCAPVDPCHIVIESYAVVPDSRCLAVSIDDIFTQPAALLMKLPHIWVLRRWNHGHGTVCAVVLAAVRMNPDQNLGSVFPWQSARAPHCLRLCRCPPLS